MQQVAVWFAFQFPGYYVLYRFTWSMSALLLYVRISVVNDTHVLNAWAAGFWVRVCGRSAARRGAVVATNHFAPPTHESSLINAVNLKWRYLNIYVGGFEEKIQRFWMGGKAAAI